MSRHWSGGRAGRRPARPGATRPARPLHDGLRPLQSLVHGRGLAAGVRGAGREVARQSALDRPIHHPGATGRRRREKGVRHRTPSVRERGRTGSHARPFSWRTERPEINAMVDRQGLPQAITLPPGRCRTRRRSRAFWRYILARRYGGRARRRRPRRARPDSGARRARRGAGAAISRPGATARSSARPIPPSTASAIPSSASSARSSSPGRSRRAAKRRRGIAAPSSPSLFTPMDARP